MSDVNNKTIKTVIVADKKEVDNAVNNKTIKRIIVAESYKKEKVVVPISIPRKLNVDAQQSDNIYEPDIESFVSNCIPGVCFTSTINQRRNTKIRKRSLPSLQYLATVELSEAEKKRSKMEKEQQDAKAKEEARRILLNQNEQPGSDVLDNDKDAKVPHKEVAATKGNVEEEIAIPTTVTTTTIEGKSNILNPPILQDFLEKVRKRRALDK